MDEQMIRLVEALENVAAELERLRLLREYELGARVEYSHDPNVVRAEGAEE